LIQRESDFLIFQFSLTPTASWFYFRFLFKVIHMGMGPFTLFATVALVFLGICAVIQLPMISVLVHNSKNRDAVFQTTIEALGKWIPDSRCASSTCQTGLAFVQDGVVSGCSVLNDLPGTTCSNECHVEDTALTCNSQQECVSAEPTTCLGYCHINTTGPYTFEYGDPECDGKLTFRAFNQWNTSESSSDAFHWLYYSDYPAECSAYVGCIWYSWRVMARRDPEFAGVVINDPVSNVDCLDFLNMSNSDCIQAKAITIGPAISTPVWTEIATNATQFPNATGVEYLTEMCLYSFKCFTQNETFFSDPAYLVGEAKKRSLDATASQDLLVDDAVRVLKQHGARSQHPHLGAYLAHVMKKDEMDVE
jgi:hypothetical protein